MRFAIFAKIFAKKLPKFKALNYRHQVSFRSISKSMGSSAPEGGWKGEWDVIMEGRANDVYNVTKYRSKSTGLELVHAAIEGPIVNGYIVLATRAEDDDGLPHTLEHLLFMGSEDYPYKGVLDILANKCFASGTNAWTDVDHTAYTLTTAGSQGFCNMLGIYMDHIFHPILSDSAFVTEVYHTTGEGTDAGVVYCEIVAKENTPEETVYKELTRTLYPPTSGYHYQTGGICKNLRESCNNDKVKAFHKQFYNPRNACIIVCGMVEPAELFASIASNVDKLVAKGAVPSSWDKPWLDEIPEIGAPVEKHLKFPAEEDDDEGMITVGFRGPSAIAEVETVAALRLLLEYLTDSAVSPLQLAFVENDNPFCSDVSFGEIENSTTTYYVSFEGVDKNKMGKVVGKLKDSLERQIKKFDPVRMGDIIRKNYQEELSSMENTPHNAIAYAVIGDFLYGSDKQDMFEKRINAAKIIRGFLDQPSSFWTSLIKERILGQKWVSIFASPCANFSKQLSNEEKGRVEDRRGRLGALGLEKLGQELEEAVRINSAPAPQSVLEKVAVPNASSIHFHSITRHANPEWVSGLKCNLYVDDIKSNFVYISVLMDCSGLTYTQRKYLPLFRELLVESPVMENDGTLVGFESVVAELNRVWLSHGVSLGIDGGGRFKCGSYNHTFTFHAQIELSKLEIGFDWIRKILWKTVWNVDRTKIVATKMAGDIPQLKRKGNRMAYLLLKDILYKGNSNMKISSLVRQQQFLKEVGKLDEKKLSAMFESIRSILTTPENMTIHVAASLSKLDDALKGTTANNLDGLLSKTFVFSPDSETSRRLANEPDFTWMNDASTFVSAPETKIMGNRTEDAAYLVKVSPGPNDFNHLELPALLTAMQYLTQTEGPFYRVIRGTGLAYDCYMDLHCHEGLIYFALYRCSDVVLALAAAKEIVKDHLKAEEWSEEFLSSAKSSLIFEYIEGEKTPLALSSTSLCSYFRNVPDGYTKNIIQKIMALELKDLQKMTEKYLYPLFFGDHVCSIVVPLDKVVGVVEGFEKVHEKKIQTITGIQNSVLEKWEEENKAN